MKGAKLIAVKEDAESVIHALIRIFHQLYRRLLKFTVIFKFSG